MAKKATNTRKRRSDAELISDLKNRIQELRQRQEARELKKSPAIRSTLSAVRYIDKALESAAREEIALLRHALAEARKPLESFLKTRGVRLPKARVPRGRKPKAVA